MFYLKTTAKTPTNCVLSSKLHFWPSNFGSVQNFVFSSGQSLCILEEDVNKICFEQVVFFIRLLRSSVRIRENQKNKMSLILLIGTMLQNYYSIYNRILSRFVHCYQDHKIRIKIWFHFFLNGTYDQLFFTSCWFRFYGTYHKAILLLHQMYYIQGHAYILYNTYNRNVTL